MTPISYEGNNDNCVFHYSFKDLRLFIDEHRHSGAAGKLLIKKEGDFLFYKCSGTCDNPLRSEKLITFMFRMLESFTGKFEIDNIMNPKPIFETDKFITMIPLNKEMKELSDKDVEKVMSYRSGGCYNRRFVNNN